MNRPTPRFRLRVAHKLFLLLAIAIGLALLTMGALTVYNLRSGFVDYVNTMDLARLDPLANTLAARADVDPEFDSLRDAAQWHDLLRSTLDAPALRGPPDEAAAPQPVPASPPPPPPPPLPPDAPHPPPPLPPRISLLDAQRQLIAGRPPVHGALERPVRHSGAVVGWLALQPLTRPAERRDLAFLATQVRNLAMLTALLLLIAVVLAWIFARHLLAPLRAVERAARQLSDGQFGTQLSTQRHDELGDLVHHMNRLSLALQAHENARQRWMADISHELRTPLAIVRGELEAMRDGVRTLDAKGLQSLHEEVMRLDRLVGDLHQWSMADAGSLSYRPQRLDLAELAAQTCARFDATAHEAGLSLQCAGSPTPVNGDRDRLRQLIDNVVGNSLRYSDRGGRVEVSVSIDGGVACLRVDDSPPGVPAEAIGQLFEPLCRGEQSRNRASGGSGLGLAIAQRIAQAHAGTLGASQSPLGGLRLELRLPGAET